MFGISEETVKRLREQYPVGCRVELVHMDDPYNKKLVPGSKGTVTHIDDIGTIFVAWDCGSSLGIVYGEDSCKVIDDTKKDNITKLRTCPRCGKSYNEHPALSREDNKTLICPDCGTREALRSLGVSEEEQNEIIATIHKQK